MSYKLHCKPTIVLLLSLFIVSISHSQTIISIAAARADADNDFVPDLLDSLVTITGVITSPNFGHNNKIHHYLQDNSAGIRIFSAGLVPPPQLSPGDSLVVAGIMKQFDGNTYVEPQSVNDITVVGTGEIPGPLPISAAALGDTVGEAIEGFLVILEEVTIIPGDEFPLLGRWGTIRVVDSLGDTADVFIDNDTDIDGTPTPSGVLNITAIAEQFDQALPLDGDYNIRPRSLSDIVSNPTGISNAGAEFPDEFRLSQNYPNPFNPSTTIEFALEKRSKVQLKVFDIAGREVAMLVDEAFAPGSYNVVFEATGLPSGVYFYRITAGGFVQTKKLMLLK